VEQSSELQPWKGQGKGNFLCERNYFPRWKERRVNTRTLDCTTDRKLVKFQERSEEGGKTQQADTTVRVIGKRTALGESLICAASGYVIPPRKPLKSKKGKEWI